MTEHQMNAIVEAVLAALPAQPPSPAPSALIPVEASARHVHLTQAAAETLFGPGAKLTQARALSQPGEFLSEQRVNIVTPGGMIENAAVLGPVRGAVQAELSMTDTRALGINAPVRLSGDLRGAADVVLVGPAGVLEAKGSAIVAQNHVHMTPADARRFGVQNGQALRVRAGTRNVTFEHVIARVSETFALAMHIDFDEANACGLQAGEQGQLLGIAAGETAQPAAGCCLEDKLITEARAIELVRAGQAVVLRRGTIITPAARDVLQHGKIKINFI